MLTVSALQIVTFSLAAAGMASFITDTLVSLSASCLVVVLARQSGRGTSGLRHGRRGISVERCGFRRAGTDNVLAKRTVSCVG